jgi:PAS domain S-box-containing protein
LRAAPSGELAQLRARLADAEETLRAIRAGEVDTVLVAGKKGPQVFTLQGAEHAYRVLIESMNEGALTLTVDKTILYANQCFAGMLKRPLDEVIGRSLRAFVSAGDRAILRPLMKRSKSPGTKVQVFLNAGDGSRLPVQVSVRHAAARGNGQETVGMIVTDMSEVWRNEETLRALSHRLVQAQEAERGRVALELHDHITQLLCAIVMRSQALVNSLSTHDGPPKDEALKLNEMLDSTIEEVERISRDLRPSVLDQLGLGAVLRTTGKEFAVRTGVSMKLVLLRLRVRLPADTELTLYRILQEALANVERHASARNVTVQLRKEGAFVLLSIHDDGIGFRAVSRPGDVRKRKNGLGLLAMRERAGYVGGTVSIRSTRRTGTEIEVRVPTTGLRPGVAAAGNEFGTVDRSGVPLDNVAEFGAPARASRRVRA